MRFAVVAWVLSVASVTAHADVELRPSSALRLGVHHTSVDKDDGSPAGWGPRIEAAGELAIGRYVAVSAVAAASWYGDDGLEDSVTGMTYELSVRDLWIGARILGRPHPRVFVGLGIHEVFTRERSSLLGGITGSFHHMTPELIAGGTVATYRAFRMQVIATAGRYQRFDDLEQVQFVTLSLGVQR